MECLSLSYTNISSKPCHTLIVTFQGKYAEAQRLQAQALSVQEKAMGPGHPEVAMACNLLALCMMDQVT